MILFAHENKTMMHWSKIACARDNWTKLKETLKKTDAFESYRRERMITKMQILEFDKINRIYCFAEKHSHSLERCSFSQTSAE